MQKKETAIEVKVGALVLFSIALLTAFVLVLGDFSFSDGFTFQVDFENAGGLKPGADVAIAGLNVGNVQKLEFINDKTKKASADMNIVAARATVTIDGRYAESVRKNSQFFVTTRGVLGEPYIEIVTETFDKPAIAVGETLRGVDPPRIDVIVAKASRLLTVLTDLLDNPSVATRDLIINASQLFKTLNEILQGNRPVIDDALKGLRDTTQRASKLLDSLNLAIDDGKDVKAIIGDLRSATSDLRVTARDARRISGRVNRDLDPIISDVKTTASNARQLTEDAKGLLDRNGPRVDRAVANLERASEDVGAISKDARAISADTRQIVARIKRGEGTVGKLMTDREMYDDLKELLRQIKRKPWKIIWKE